MERNSTRSFVSTSRWVKQPNPSTRAAHKLMHRNSCGSPASSMATFRTVPILPNQQKACMSSQRARYTSENVNECFSPESQLSRKVLYEKVIIDL